MVTPIEVRRARTHNLKDVDVDVPRHRLVVFTGVSGSGKSSLAFDTIYTEAQRQLIETFSTYARRRLPKLTRPPVDEIRNISPCIVIDQKRLGASSRSTVGTATEIYTYLRMLYSRAARPFAGWSHVFSFNHPDGMCPGCKGLGKRITVDLHKLLDRTRTIREGAIQHPDYDTGKWYYRQILWSGVLPADKPLSEFSDEEMDRLLWADRLPISYEDHGKTYQRTFDGVARKLEQLHVDKDEDQISGVRRIAYKRLFHATTCRDCAGDRLNRQSLSVELAGGQRIGDLINLELTDLDEALATVADQPEYDQIRPAVETLVSKMRSSLRHLIDIGVGYLSLNRGVNTLSGGESQRVKMARQLDCDLIDLIYILDEPSVGLHARDIDHLIGMLSKLRDAGNSVLVVEHDTSIMRAADWIIDIGPEGGDGGGHVLYNGPPGGLVTTDSATGRAFASGPIRHRRQRRRWKETLAITNATRNNLRNVSVEIPKGVLTCLTGVAGSGKSSLIHEFINNVRDVGGKVVSVDQTAVGRSWRSNPATYIGIFDAIRQAFAKANGVSPSLFSFNSKGSCPECRGKGHVEMELSFIDDVRLECSMCRGKRYRDEVLEHRYGGMTIADLLELTVAQAIGFFTPPNNAERSREARIISGLQLLADVGVGYLRLGQSLPTLSGGEAQRLKLAAELTKTGNLYVMDEPSTGLHPLDIDRLLAVIDRLIGGGNTVVIVEHNLDIISAADWIVDIGPGGGKDGGTLVATGTPETIAMRHDSYTGRYLKSWLEVP